MIINLNSVAPAQAEKLQTLMLDEAFVAKVFAMKTAEEAQREFEKNGVELTIDTLKEMANAINAAEETADDEIDQEMLEQVSGGGRFTISFKIKGIGFDITISW